MTTRHLATGLAVAFAAAGCPMHDDLLPDTPPASHETCLAVGATADPGDVRVGCRAES